MKNSLKRGALFLGTMALSAIFVTSCDDQEEQITTDAEKQKEAIVTFEKQTVIPGRYIVTLNKNFGANLRSVTGYSARQDAGRKVMGDLLRDAGLNESQLKMAYTAPGAMGFAVENVDDVALSRLKNMPSVLDIEQDKYFVLAPWYCDWFPNWPGCDDDPEPDPTQSTPWGITRVGGATDYSSSSKKAWVIDTGIDLDHNDLNVDTQLSRSFVGSSANDGHGHGTHVAGTIGAIDNNIGVVGVAAGVTLVAVQVLGANGGGSNASVIGGIDYVAQTANAGDVANLSLGGSASSAIDNAVINMGNAGIYVSLAAGNESQNANNVSPARANGSRIFTVSSMTNIDRLSSFSNFSNPPVDFAAPGSNVYSTWKNGDYNTISGTSMAAPHVAGLLLVTNGSPNSDGTIAGDRDSTPDPIAHK